MATRSAVPCKLARVFPLLKLPTELRLEVLRELLVTDKTHVKIHHKCPMVYFWREPPLEPNAKTFKFCVAILRTCRQLYKEGMPILYEQNTFNTSINAPDRGFLVPERILIADGYTISSTVANRVQRLQLRIPVCFVSIRRQMAQFALQIEYFPNLQYLSIEVYFYRKPNDPIEVEEKLPTERAEEILRGLHVVRGLKTVKFTGLVPTYAAELIAHMTSSLDLANLTQMFGDLEYFLSAIGSINRRSMMDQFRRPLRQARDAMDKKDPRRFFAARGTIMNAVEVELQQDEQDVFKYD